MSDLEAARDELTAELVIANAVLHARGVVDAFGHVSVRCGAGDQGFLLARSMPPGLVRREDILLHDLSGAPRDAGGPAPYLERFIHSEIYAAHPGVMAVVHSHSPAMVTFGCVPSVTLAPMYHMAAFLGRGVARFEIRDTAGDGTDLLVRNPLLGAALATAIGGRALVLMRGHGSTVVGQSLRQAVFRAVYAEANARMQIDARALGAASFLSAGEAIAAEQVMDAQAGRAWELWRAELGL